jgi:hypothetical protein
MKTMVPVAMVLACALATVAMPVTAAGRAPGTADVHALQAAQARRPATPAVLKLFAAASEGDEATFNDLLGTVGDLNHYVVDGNKLLHALLRPAASLRVEATGQNNAADTDQPERLRWLAQRARHAALVPAKTRMLARALAQGAAVDDGDADGEVAALHLAAMYGTRAMVAMLLAHGADPMQRGAAFQAWTPLEYALIGQDVGVALAELMTPDERSAICLALLAANGAPPFGYGDERDDEPGARQPIDMIWYGVVQRTTGTEVLDRLERTGSHPSVMGAPRSHFAYAAEAGNAAAVGWLKTRVPRFDANGNDRWLDAAIWAMYLPQPAADAVLTQLLVPQMRWEQRGKRSDPVPDFLPMPHGADPVQLDDTVLAHAVHAGRADWVARLVALGAPLSPAGVQELGVAVSQGDAGMVKVLLGLGADPLTGTPGALERALYGPATATDPGGSLPAQAAVLVPLLLDQIVTARKMALAAIPGAPLEQAIRAAADADPEDDTDDGTARVRLLLGAGFSAASLGDTAAAAAMAMPDRGLAAELLDQGMLRTTAPGMTHVLLSAVAWRRTDLLPRLLQLGLDPNLRSGSNPSPVDYAIQLGAIDEVVMLLAGGGRIDLARRDAHGGVLDRAVASGSAAMLRLASGNPAQRLDLVCLPDAKMLVKTVLTAAPAYWDLLRAQGFGTDEHACPGQAERVVLALSAEPQRILAGWLGANLRSRLPQLGSTGTTRAAVSATVWPLLAARGRDDLRQLLAQSGWPAPASTAPSSATDGALRTTVPGTYAARELDSTIVLRQDGTFAYRLKHGNIDQAAQGHWTVGSGQVMFSSPVQPARPFLLAARTGPAPDGQVAVTMGHGRRDVQDVTVTLLGDAPSIVQARPDSAGWSGRLPGPLRQIVFMLPSPERPIVVDMPAAPELGGTFLLTVNPEAAPELDLNLAMALTADGMVWTHDGVTLHYKKSPAPARRHPALTKIPDES